MNFLLLGFKTSEVKKFTHLKYTHLKITHLKFTHLKFTHNIKDCSSYNISCDQKVLKLLIFENSIFFREE